MKAPKTSPLVSKATGTSSALDEQASPSALRHPALTEAQLLQATLALPKRSPTDPEVVVQGGMVLSGGRINVTWLIETSIGPMILRTYPETRRERQVEFEMAILAHLHADHCAVPSPLSLVPEPAPPVYIGVHESGEMARRPYVWLNFLPGTPLDQASALDCDPADLVELLEPIFDSLRGFSPPFHPVLETQTFEKQLLDYCALQNTTQGPSPDALLTEFRRLQAWEQSHPLPGGVVHGDLRPENVLRDSAGKLWVVDFDCAHVGTRALDWVLVALEFSLAPPEISGSGGSEAKVYTAGPAEFEGWTIDEDRYRELLREIIPERTKSEEFEALPTLREILLLKKKVEHLLPTR